MVQEICNHYNIQVGVIKLACDNIKALSKRVDLNYFVSPQHSHFDLIQALIRKIPMEWTTQHVNGHQDEDPYKAMDQWPALTV